MAIPINGSEFFALQANLGQSIINQLPMEQVATFAGSGPIARTFSQRFSDVINLADWAKGDGVTNDTSAVQNAINSAPNGSMIFAPGTYLCGNIQIQNKTGLTLFGGGTFRWTGTAPAGQYIGIQLLGSVTDLTIENITLVGDGVSGTFGDGGAGTHGHAGIWNSSGQTILNLRVLGCFISNTTVGIALTADLGGSIAGAVISENYLTNIVGGNIGQGYGIHVNAGSGNVERVRIINNNIELVQRHSIYQAGGVGASVIGNHIKNHRTVLQSGDSHGNGRPAIELARSSGLVCLGNIIDTVQDCAIGVETDTNGTTSRNVIVANNIIRNYFSFYGMFVGPQGSPTTNGFPENVTITSNIFTNDYSTTTNNLAAIVLWCGKQVTVHNNKFEMLNSTVTNDQFLIFGNGESGTSSTYNDNFRFLDNEFHSTGAGTTRNIRFDTASQGMGARMEFRGNRNASSGATFNAPGAITAPNLIAYSNPVDGLDMTKIRQADGGGFDTCPIVSLTFGATINIDAGAASKFILVANSATQFLFNAPINGTIGQRISVKIKNTSAGALNATVPWTGSAAYKYSTWTQPAAGFSRAIVFVFDGSSWVQENNPIDVPN